MTSELALDHDHGCFVPLELIPEILLRVPVKSVGRFKSVCKSWNSLFSTHNFAKSHHELNNPASLLFVLRYKGSVFPLNLNLKDISNLAVSSVALVHHSLYPGGNCKYYCRELSTGVNEHNNVCVCQLPFTPDARFVVQMWMLEEQRQHGDWKLIFRIGLESQFSKKFPHLLGLTLNGNILIKISDGQEHQVWLLDPSQYPPTYKIVMKKNVVYVTDFVANLISPHYVC